MEDDSSTIALITLLFSITLFSLSLHSTAVVDIIKANQNISDGIWSFRAWFNPGNSTNRYVSIWYENISKKTVFWVANRESPLNTSGLLKLNSDGNLVILDASDHVIWSSNSLTSVNNPVLQLLNSGNLVIMDETDSPLKITCGKVLIRGLLYLRQDFRLRIIHRDLKASNVLLDQKLLDFRTTRICRETETGANTTRVAGT
ncbi:hypothetical protein POM88_010801 [Heracleum sosnowskyi]|uniref:Bulb-type lectin domain-containing protein n=1 Tax=Heracleum sosnowskyi TaxID=360622 RepID=A0AAD8ITU1_9APIA|nr:hypothetical protein POM88_010801 [Heracleum sosnowskyi]